MLRHAVALLGYTALTVALTWPLVFQLGSVAPNDLGDPLLSTWTLWWNATTLPLTERWWDGPIFFPAHDSLTLSDHRIGLGIISTPIIWLGWSPMAAHNLTFLASFVLCALGGYALGFSLTRHHGAAFLAGLVFGFNPFRAGHLPHLELLCSYWLPVALLALHRWGETRKPVWLVGLSAALTMQAVTSVYYFAFFSVVVGLWLVWFVRLRLTVKECVALGASLATPLVLIAPILLRYRRAHESMGLTRTIVEIEGFSADLVGLVTTPQTLALWNSPMSWDKGEGALYPGAVAVALVLAALLVTVPPPAPAWPTWGVRLRRTLLIGAAMASCAAAIPAVWGPVSTEVLGVPVSISQSFKPISVAVLLVGVWLLTTARVRREWRARSALAFFALATVAMWLFALGPTGRVLGERFLYKAPYSWLMLLPGVDTAFRVPARFGMLAALTLCAATALAWAGLTRGRSRRWTAAATAVAALAILIDSWIKPMQLPALPAALEIPADTPPDAVVLKLPLETFEDAEAMYQAIGHRRPSVNGMSGYAPASYQGRHIPRALGTAFSYLGVAAVVTITILLVAPLATSQYDELAEEWPELRRDLRESIDDLSERSVEDDWPIEIPTYAELERQFSGDTSADADGDGQISEEERQDRFADQLDTARELGLRVFHVGIIFVLAPIIAFYMLVDLPHIREVARSLVPERARGDVMVVSRRLSTAIGGYFRGQLAVAFVVGTMSSIGMLVIDLPFWLIVGMVAGLFNMIPLIGPWVGAVPGIVIALTTGGGLDQAIWVAVVMAGVQQIDNHFISPIVMQRAVKLHPAVVMLALLAGGTLGGFFGLLLAVPATATLKIIVGHAWRHFILGQPLDEIEAEWERDDAEPGVGPVESLRRGPAEGDDRAAQPGDDPEADGMEVGSGARRAP